MQLSLNVRMNLIKQANEFCCVEKGSQVKPGEMRGQVSAAMLFGTARSNTWVAANGFKDGKKCVMPRSSDVLYSSNNFK